MPNSLASLPRWKQAVAGVCLLYAFLAWVLPVFMIPVVNVLPFVHQRDIYERLAISAVGTLLFFATLTVLDPRRMLDGLKSLAPTGSRWRRLSHWFGVALGLGMFTFGAAALSANVLGLLTRILPGQPYLETVVLESVDFSGGSRHRAASVRYESPAGGALREVTFSGKLFDYPRFAPGDTLELRGKQGPVGVYVTDFRLVTGVAGR